MQTSISNPVDPALAPPATAERVLADQTRLLIANIPLSAVMSSVVAGLLAYAMVGHVSTLQALIWLGLVVTVCLARIAIWYVYNRGLAPNICAGRWCSIFELGAFGIGLALGTSAIFIFPTGSLAHQVFIGFVLGSFASAGICTLGLHLKSYLLFLFPILTPFTLRLMLEGGDLQIFMGVIFLLGQGFLLINARRFEAVTLNALSLKHEKGELVAALQAAVSTAQEASQAKTQFLANMSHEIRTPLSGIVGLSELLRKTPLTPQQTKLSSSMTHSANTLLGLVDDVLDISRIESGKFALNRGTFSLRRCVEDAVDMCAGAGYRKGLELNLIVENLLPTEVIGDEQRLRQVLINLLGNSIKFTESGQITVRVSTSRPENGRTVAVFRIIDTGIGIAPRDMERLFKPFVQADASSQRRFGGTGLGLAITRHLIDLMGGDVRLESELGRGTLVQFDVPFDLAVPAGFRLEPALQNLDGCRVLIIDDRALAREAFGSMFVGAGVRLDTACSETEALAKLRRACADGDPFRVLLVDRMRPHKNSIAFLQKVRSDQQNATLQIVALVTSGWQLTADVDAALAPASFIHKPVRREEVAAAIAVGSPSLQRSAATPGDDGEDLTGGLPALADQPISQLAMATDAALDGLSVLVAEDNLVNQEVIVAYLAGFGCKPVVANDGLEAIAAFGKSHFDVVLMDCQMPQVDGLSAIREIRSREKEVRTPIVMVTANAFESDRAQAFAAGADEFLSKPFSEAQLKRIMLEQVARILPKAA